MKKLFLLGAAFLALQAVPALAEEGKGGKHHEGKFFDMQDANKDGVVTEDEAVSFAKAKFAEVDADKDGKLTKEEAKTHRDKKRAEWKAKREEMKASGAKPAEATAPAPSTEPAPAAE